MNEYFTIYLFGCGLAAILILAKAVILAGMLWLTKESILQKNMKKLQPPDDRSGARKLFGAVVAWVFESLLSWINVLVVPVLVAGFTFRVLRERFSAVPEEILRLRYPLWNNPGLSREAVWSYCFALASKVSSDVPTESAMRMSLQSVEDYYPDFDSKEALMKLKSLNVFDESLISRALESPVEIQDLDADDDIF